jgi:LPXTG-motif cell wall-anchored protein
MKRIAAVLAMAGGFLLIGGTVGNAGDNGGLPYTETTTTVEATTTTAAPTTTVAPTTTIAGTTTTTIDDDSGAGVPTTTVAGQLPDTGSNSSGPTVVIATVLLLAGAGMFLVAQVRRRQPTTI